MNIKDIETATLWALLADMAEMEVMKSPSEKTNFKYWHELYTQIRTEIDKRMLMAQ